MKRILRWRASATASLALLILSTPLRADPAQPLIQAIRSGNKTRVAELLSDGGEMRRRDERGNTALHWAALANDAELVTKLLASGSDPQATNAAGATPLHYGTGNSEVIRLLLRAGAKPNARSLAGATPFHAAVVRPGGLPVVQQMIEGGADWKQPRSLFPAGVNVPMADPSFGVITPLSLATYYGAERSAELLLKLGADPSGAKGATPVASAALAGRAELLEELVRRGGSVNFDDGFVGHAFNNIMYGGHTRLARLVLDRGLDLQQTTSIGERTPPMVWSAYSETGDPAVAKLMLEKGLDINTPTGAGHTALDWAVKRGETPLVAFLRAHGATNSAGVARKKVVPQNEIPSQAQEREAAVRESVRRAIQGLQRSSDVFLANGFVKQSGCVSCHHQTVPAWAIGRARTRGIPVDEAALARQLHAQQTAWSKGLDAAYEMFEPQPDSPANLGYGLLGLKALGYAPDALTEAMVYYIANSQLEDGSFPGYDRRPPMEEGQTVGVALAIGALRAYPQPLPSVDVDGVIGRARQWLTKQNPIDPNLTLYRLLGLKWAGAKPSEIAAVADAVLAAQRADGGWAPLPTLPSDAWATAFTLFVLHETGRLAASDSQYRRGTDYLLRTQFSDGSWWVQSRTWPLQPHFDSQYPHGKDQWISAGATAMASVVLLNEIEPAATLADPGPIQTLLAKYPPPAAATAPAGKDDPDAAKPAVAAETPFSREIAPIFERSCRGCHGGENPKGGFKVDSVASLVKGGQSGEPAVVPGQPDRSPLLRYVTDALEDLEMPPLSKRNKFPALTQAEVGTIRAWIRDGAR